MNVYFGSKTKADTDSVDDEDDQEDSNIYRENNRIYFYSEIDRASTKTLMKLIREAEHYSFMTAFQLGLESIPIYIHISSQGGYIYHALSVVDAIKRCRVPIYSVVEGPVASAGTFISMVCQKRFICPNAFMMIHQLSGGVGGKMGEITDEYANLTELMEVIKQLYTEHAKMSQKVLGRLLKRDLYLNAKKALKYGLADELFL
jgi:ATP-dependent Clp endopeptidase proteolytic subunit ClpP